MNCLEFQTQLEAAILGRTNTSPQLAEHGCRCSDATCRAQWSDYVLLASSLPQWKAESLEYSSLNPLSVARAASEPVTAGREPTQFRRPSVRSLSWNWLPVAIAGVALVGLITALNPLPKHGDLVHTPNREVPAGSESMDTPAVATAPEESHEVLSELSHTYVGWIHGSAHQISETVAFVLSDPPMVEPLPVLPWYDTLQQQFRPLEESIQRTVDGLLQEVSGEAHQAS